jgi:hypothetical protein
MGNAVRFSSSCFCETSTVASDNTELLLLKQYSVYFNRHDKLLVIEVQYCRDQEIN